MSLNLEAGLALRLDAGIVGQPPKMYVVEPVPSFPLLTQGAVDLALLVSNSVAFFRWRCQGLRLLDLVFMTNFAPIHILQWLGLMCFEVALDVFHGEPPALLQA